MTQCALCAQILPKNPIIEGAHHFCCSGCHLVYQIIGTQENYQTHPLFQEALKVGVIANPTLEAPKEGVEDKTREVKVHLQIEEMWCPACAAAIRLLLMRQKGIYSCAVDYTTDLALIRINPMIQSKEGLIAYIEKLGYRAKELYSQEKQRISHALWLRFAVAAFCMLNIMMFSYPLYAEHFGIAIEGYGLALGWLSLFLSLPLIFYAAWPIWKRLALSFKSSFFGTETLILIGVSSAFVLSTYHLLGGGSATLYFDSLSMVLFFVLLGKILEKKAKFSAKETLFHLTRSLPKKGYKRLASGEYVYTPLKEIQCGDFLLVRTGEKVLLDGEIVEGEGVVDEAVMTGEALPVRKGVGKSVIGGSVVQQGGFLYQVTKSEEHSLLGQIVQLIENDLEKRGSTLSALDQITRYFIPLVLLLALFFLLFSGPVRALTILMISCPCAIGIAAPLAQSRLLFRFAEKGALVRNRARLSALGKKPFFVFDKTGTLTHGKFELLKGLENLTLFQTSLLKGLALHSNHPTTSALLAVLTGQALSFEKVEEVVGRGMRGEYQGTLYLLGSAHFLEEHGILLPEKKEKVTSTLLYFAANDSLLTTLYLGDRLRPHLPKVEGGILSGDHPDLVEAVARQCGFLWGKGGLSPQQKREEILKLKDKGRPIVMVGDGVNDAPAMALADLGISVVSASDLAVSVSDILLTTDHLEALPELCHLIQKGERIITQNLFLAFFYNTVGIGLACLGVLNPLFAALAMALSSLSVTLNSLRL